MQCKKPGVKSSSNAPPNILRFFVAHMEDSVRLKLLRARLQSTGRAHLKAIRRDVWSFPLGLYGFAHGLAFPGRLGFHGRNNWVADYWACPDTEVSAAVCLAAFSAHSRNSTK